MAANQAADGSAGDANYALIGSTYSRFRLPDPRIAALLLQALGESQSILNVGAGAGSYEPADRAVTAVEPSATMRSQRPPGLPLAIDAVAEDLPFRDRAFDAAMATFTVHQWADLARGLSEMRRVATGPVVIMTCDPLELRRFWLNDYAPEALDVEATRYPTISTLANLLGGKAHVIPAPIPLDCIDGFNEAYYGRPEMLLNPEARLACSAWSFVEPHVVERFERRLGADLARGEWDRRYGHLRSQPTFEGSLKIVVALP